MLFWIYVIEYLNSSKRRFSNPVFQNLCSNLYFWGVKTQVSKFGFKTDIENPKLEKLNFWSTLIDPMKIPSEICPPLKEWTNWLEQDTQVQEAVEEIFNSNPEYIDWKTKFFDYTDGNSYITLAQTKGLNELCSKKFDFRQFSNCKLKFEKSFIF